MGCGLPTQYAEIKPGDTVVNLGAGAGNDCFIAREEVGTTGRVIGVDFAPNMLLKARENAQRRGFTNVEFLEGDIENMPLPDAMADVIVSNCVLNLLPRKDRIFKEIYRVLKPGARFCISELFWMGSPSGIYRHAAMYAGALRVLSTGGLSPRNSAGRIGRYCGCANQDDCDSERRAERTSG